MQFLTQPKFEFMKWGSPVLGASLILVLIMTGVLVFKGLNLGIEFVGGTELQVKYVDRPDVAEIRETLARAGLTSQTVTTIGDPEEHEIYIRIGSAEEEAEESDLTTRVTRALRAAEGAAHEGLVDLNVVDRATVETPLMTAPGLTAIQAANLAEAIVDKRKILAVYSSFDDLADLEGATPEVLADLQTKAYLGPLAVRSQSYIFPAVGRELMEKAIVAVIMSLIGMLIYIWVRFQLQWGFAAVAALAHDTLITLGLFSLFNKEMSLPVVAAFLTLVGYSVNDTVVVFDRIRENLRTRRNQSLQSTIDLSLNQTLSRTIITSGLTFLVVFGLYLFGGAALNPFAFVLSVGVLIGTFSSIYIASPILLLVKRYQKGRTPTAASSPGAGVRQAAKRVRT